jgi:hypothetical protein
MGCIFWHLREVSALPRGATLKNALPISGRFLAPALGLTPSVALESREPVSNKMCHQLLSQIERTKLNSLRQLRVAL